MGGWRSKRSTGNEMFGASDAARAVEAQGARVRFWENVGVYHRRRRLARLCLSGCPSHRAHGKLRGKGDRPGKMHRRWTWDDGAASHEWLGASIREDAAGVPTAASHASRRAEMWRRRSPPPVPVSADVRNESGSAPSSPWSAPRNADTFSSTLPPPRLLLSAFVNTTIKGTSEDVSQFAHSTSICCGGMDASTRSRTQRSVDR